MTILSAAKRSAHALGLGALREHFRPRARAQRHLVKSISLFKAEYDEYWAGLKRDRSQTDLPEVFDDIVRHGCAIRPGFISPQDIDFIREEIYAEAPEIDRGVYTGTSQFLDRPHDGICALGVSERLPHTYRVTIANEPLHRLARALFGPTTHLTAATVLNKYNSSAIDSSEVPHWDDWRVRFKIFLYLNDVTLDRAPTVYLKGSVQGVPWRLEKDFASVFMPIASAGGTWWTANSLNMEKVVCTGPAGTAVFFDATGIHAGSDLRTGNRLMLMNMYTTHIPFGFRPF